MCIDTYRISYTCTVDNIYVSKWFKRMLIDTNRISYTVDNIYVRKWFKRRKSQRL